MTERAPLRSFGADTDGRVVAASQPSCLASMVLQAPSSSMDEIDDVDMRPS